MSIVSALQQLQAADSHLASLMSQAAALEAVIAGDAELDRMREAATESAAAQRQADEAASVIEGRASQLRQRVRTIERRLYDGSVGNPQELLSLQHELEGVRERAADEEERLLAAMVVAEEAGELAREAREAVAEREQAREVEAGPNASRLAQLRDAVTEAESARAETAAAVDAAALALYTRLATRVRPPLARLQGDSCGGCRHGLGMHEVHAVRHGEGVFQCPDCDRILVP
ncbi:MAG: zinc ribbon domain-containing protein [Candidatus Dormibacteria bacterium]